MAKKCRMVGTTLLHNWLRHTVSVALLIIAPMSSTAAHAQVVINEILQNPPGFRDADQQWEFVELYGQPGMDLSGYTLALVLDQAGLCGRTELAGVFSLNGWRLDDNGFFVLVNATGGKSEGVASTLRQNSSFRPFEPESPSNPRLIGGASFECVLVASRRQLELPRLANDGASTWILIHHHPDAEQGNEPIWACGMPCDNNYDGAIDSGAEEDACLPPLRLEPYQMVDEVAWTGELQQKNYVRSEESILTDTPGFTPDAISRIRYYPANPKLGVKTRDRFDEMAHQVGYDFVRTTCVEESFVYGELDADAFRRGKLLYFDGFDMEGWYQCKSPTDSQAEKFGDACDPEPDSQPFPPPCYPIAGGTRRITDLPIVGFELTPGRYNDHVSNQNLKQFRFVRGDFNFDGTVNNADRTIIIERLGATLDDMRATSETSPEPKYRWEGAQFQQMLMMCGMCPDDGVNGANAAAITSKDLAAFDALLLHEVSTRRQTPASTIAPR